MSTAVAPRSFAIASKVLPTSDSSGQASTLASILDYEGSLIGFSDAGAHLRNMAFYNFPLRMLKFVRDAQLAGRPFMSIERAVHRLTGELGDWFGLDAGTLR